MSIKIKEMFHSYIPYSINKWYIESITEFKSKTRKGLFPTSLDTTEIPISKSISFFPYCLKPENCPMNTSHDNRKNQNCLKLNGNDCHVADCSIYKIVNVLFEHGFNSKQIFLIDSDDNLFQWLKAKHKEGYRYFYPGIGCHYGVSYALTHITKDIGYKGGVIGFIEDDTCKTLTDYLGMEGEDKGKHTTLSINFINQINKILKENRGEKHAMSLQK